MQSPDNQVVTDKVWHELAFGLESLGASQGEIRLRVAEMASFFGMQTWFHKNVSELSGGQKQLLNLASIMAMQPSAIILDEPTSQLDPIAASEFLSTIEKINRELGVTVVMTEHRLDDTLPLCRRAVVMDGGRVIEDGNPAEVGAALRRRGHGMFSAMPAPMRIWAGVENSLPCPLTVRDGREWLGRLGKLAGGGPASEAPTPAGRDLRRLPNGADGPRGREGQTPAVEFEDVWFRYEKDEPDIVKGLSFKAYPGEIAAILGGNGAGKTTALSMISGANAPLRGGVRINGEPVENFAGRLFDNMLGILPQNPQTLFVHKTVESDLLEMLAESKLPKDEKRRRMRGMAALCRVDGLLHSHPYDLSGGEQQRAALAKVLLLQPRILLLDEPTKGLDAEFKLAFARILKSLAAAGAAIVMVSHDLPTARAHGDWVVCLNRRVVAQGPPEEVFRPSVLAATFGLHQALEAGDGPPFSGAVGVPAGPSGPAAA
jgi:energy-coupling factor transport system ATP-binding protein